MQAKELQKEKKLAEMALKIGYDKHANKSSPMIGISKNSTTSEKTTIDYLEELLIRQLEKINSRSSASILVKSRSLDEASDLNE